MADAAGADEEEDNPDDAEDDLLAELLDRDAVPVTEVAIPDVVDAVVEDTVKTRYNDMVFGPK